MFRQQQEQDLLFLAIFPYGARHSIGDCDSPGLCLDLGAAIVAEAGRLRREEYVLERAGRHWRLSSRLDDQQHVTLAYVRCSHLPDAATAAGLESLRMVWALRSPARLQLDTWLGGGVLTPDLGPTQASGASSNGYYSLGMIESVKEREQNADLYLNVLSGELYGEKRLAALT